jgi:hypothetical protein
MNFSYASVYIFSATMDWKVSFIFQYPEFFREKKMIYKLATHGFIWHGHGVELEFGQFHVAIQNGSLFIGLSSSVGKIKLILVNCLGFWKEITYGVFILVFS